MKLKLHLTLFLFFLSFYTSQAQYRYGYGGFMCYSCDTSIEAGILLSNVNGLEASERPGFYLGLYEYKEFNDNWAIRFGVGYTNTGAKLKDYKKDFILHSGILEPISVHYTFMKKYKVFLGGDLAMHVAGKVPMNGPDDSDFTFLPKNINTIDFSLFAGTGYKVTENIDLHLRYNLGLSNLNDAEDDDKKAKWKRNYLTVSFAYTFR